MMENLPALLQQLRSSTRDPGALELLHAEYKNIRSQTLAMKTELGLTSEAGAQTCNIKKNRYKDILPSSHCQTLIRPLPASVIESGNARLAYDQTRVVLRKDTDFESDYINANFIQGAPGSGRLYIASQGPLGHTVEDFWRMVWKFNVKVIIMASREIEMGKKKCEFYWAAVDQTSTFGSFSIYNGEVSPNEDYVLRNLTVTHQQVSRSVYQYQYTSWPDHDVPDKISGVLDLLDKTRLTQHKHTAPVLLHCSAGCGRTGVICILDYILDLLVSKQIPADFSIGNILTEMRLQRPAIVQTKEQYQFIFTAATVMFERALRSPDPRRHSNYTQNSDSSATRSPRTLPRRTLPSAKMNDTYAVVSKPPKSHPPTTSPALSPSATPTSAVRSRDTPPSHHVIYDNDLPGSAATPLYSVVKPRAKPISSSGLSANPIYDMAGPTNHRLGEGSEPLVNHKDYEPFPVTGCPSIEERHSSTDASADDDYEDVSTILKTPGPMGFNSRIKKPRGPRDPPAEWSR